METPGITGISLSSGNAKAAEGVKRLVFLAAVVAAALLVATLTESADASALTTAFDSWILSGQTLNVEDQSFTIYSSSKTNEIVADYGKGSLFVQNNSCDATGIARICLDNIQYDATSRVYKIKVRGVSLAPIIRIAREVSGTEFVVGDGTKFTVKLKNTGGFARNVTFEERLPREFEVTDVDGIPLQPGRAVWKGTLDEGQEVSFTYTVTVKEVFDGSLVSALTYFDGLRLKTAYSSKIELKASSPVVLLTSIGKSNILIGEKGNLTINLTNKIPETAVVALEVTFGQGLKIISRPYGAKNTSLFNYAWSDELFKGSNKTINVSRAWFFEFVGAKVGNSNILVKVSYRPKSETNESAVRTLPTGKQSVVVSNKGIIVRTSLKETTLEANQGKKIRMHLQNLNPYAALRNVQANISTGLLYLPDLFFERMGPGEQLLLADKFFYAPAVAKSAGYIIATNVSYMTEFGDSFDKTFKDTVSVLPTQDVSLEKTVSTTIAKSDEEIEIVASVRSSRLSNIRNVRVSDNVSGDFFVISKNYANVDVKSKDTVKAYAYKVKAPRVVKDTVLHINTTMSYSDRYNSDLYAEPKDYVVTKLTEITVQPESLPLSVSRAIDDSGIYVGDLFDVKYRITNNAKDRVAKNIVLKVPLDYGLDLIGKEENVTIQQLGPGETVVVANFDKRRAKVAGDVEFSMPVVDYENVYGDRYTANGTAATLPIKEGYLQGPAVLVEKIAPKRANNTDFFGINLKVRNNGTEPVNILVEDEGRQFNITVPNSSERVLNFSKKHATVGTVEFSKAEATYSYGGSVYKTASKATSVEIVDNPVLSIEKIAPSKASNVEPYTVMLRLVNKAQTPVGNITVADGERAWAIESIPAAGHANLTYEQISGTVGMQTLPAASASYRYEEAIYKAASNSPVLNVEEKRLVLIAKKVVPETAKMSEKVTIGIKTKNLHTEELDVIVIDNAKSFTARLMPGEERNLSYEAMADEATAEPASATYTFKGQLLTTVSNATLFTLTGRAEEAVEEVVEGQAELLNETGRGGQQGGEAEKAGKKGNILSTVLNALVKILTWKRGG